MTFARKLPLLLLLLALVALLLWWFNRPGPASADAITLYGNVDIREVQLAFEVNGRIRTMAVAEGARVAAGDRLATVDPGRFEQAVVRARARLAAQRQELSALERGSRPEEIRQARAEVAAAQAASEYAGRNLERLQALAGRNLAAEEDVEAARAEARSAAARLEAAEATLALVVAGPREESVAAARANLNALEAELALAERELEDATLSAPEAGVIRDRILEPGDMASPARPVYTLAVDDPIWVRAYLPEPLLGRVRPGMRAYVVTDTFPDRRYDGWIGYIAPTAEFTPKSVQTEEVRTRLVYQTRVWVCNPQGELRLGMPAEVIVPLDQPPPDQTAVPDCAP